MRRSTLSCLSDLSPPRTFVVDVAETHEERIKGLSGVVPVPMIFPHSGETDAEYVMANMLASVEIYFVGRGGIVLAARVARPGTVVRHHGSPLEFVAELPIGSTNLLARVMTYR